jgi:hypothetical protein
MYTPSGQIPSTRSSRDEQSIPLLELAQSPDFAATMDHKTNRQDSAQSENKLELAEAFGNNPHQSQDLTDDDREWLSSIGRKEENRIFRKVDYRVIPLLSVLYVFVSTRCMDGRSVSSASQYLRGY